MDAGRELLPLARVEPAVGATSESPRLAVGQCGNRGYAMARRLDGVCAHAVAHGWQREPALSERRLAMPCGARPATRSASAAPQRVGGRNGGCG